MEAMQSSQRQSVSPVVVAEQNLPTECMWGTGKAQSRLDQSDCSRPKPLGGQ